LNVSLASSYSLNLLTLLPADAVRSKGLPLPASESLDSEETSERRSSAFSCGMWPAVVMS
jgi:hypothetical protein